MKEEEYIVVDAKIRIKLSCYCPYCVSDLDCYDYIANHLCLNVFDNVGEIFEVKCPDCGKEFEIEIEN